jgi:S1-C subfamily serine protease
MKPFKGSETKASESVTPAIKTTNWLRTLLGILMVLSFSYRTALSSSEQSQPAAPTQSKANSAVPDTALPGPRMLTLQEAALRADRGDSDAAYFVGLHILLGDDESAESTKAQHYLGVAAESGDARAMNLLGLSYDPIWSRSTNTSPQRAAELYGAAAAKGYDAASHNLNRLVARNFVSPDQAKSARTPIMLASGAEPPLPTRTSSTQDIPQSDAQKSSTNAEANPAANPAVAPGATITASTDGISQSDRKTDPKSIFARVAPAVVELKSSDNYGSGVILGSLQARGTEFDMISGDQSLEINLNFAKDPTPLAQISPEVGYLLIVTNAHVTAKAKSLRVGLGLLGEAESRVQVAAEYVCTSLNPQEDLAFVLVRQSDIPAVAERSTKSVKLYRQKSPPAKGAVVFAIGNPEGLTRTITQGLYNGLRPEGIQFDAAISVGSSGGALVHEQGDLLGITSGFVSSDNSQNLNFALPAFQIIQNLQLGQSMCKRLNKP